MQLTRKNIVIPFTFILLLFLTASTSYAQSYGQVMYGGGGQTSTQTGNIVLDKKVAHPQSQVFIDNLSPSDPKFAPNSTITFQIVISNTSTSTIKNIEIQDVFPPHIDFISGEGTFDAKNKTLTFTINTLEKGASKTITIIGRTIDVSKLPSDQNTVCIVNRASAKTKTGAKQESSDTAQLCIDKKAISAPPATGLGGTTKGGLPVFPPVTTTTTPATGPETGLLFSLLPLGLFGNWLRKQSYK